MSHRFFVAPPIQGKTAALDGPEAHHAIHVMRVGPGDRLLLFDGSGVEFAASVEAIRRDRVELRVLSRAEIDRELAVDLTLGVSLPKGDRQRWLVEKAVELGVRRIVPLVTARSVARPATGALGRLRRTVIETSKQCGRNRLAEIAEPQGWTEFVAAGPEDAVRLLAHPSEAAAMGRPPLEVLASGKLAELAPSHTVLLAVGPEGGFTGEEIAAATSAGWEQIHLGSRTLRTETAAVLLVALAACHAP